MRNSAVLLALLLASPLAAQQSDDLIVPRAFASQILIPAAGDVAGVNGTHFRSDISIVNLRSTTQRVQLFWLPQGSTGDIEAAHTLDIPPLTGVSSENFVARYLMRSGLGAIRVVGVKADDSLDPDARLQVAARIWTPRPDGAGGTMSQTFPAIALQSETAAAKSVFGLRRNSQYRLNIGIANPLSVSRRFVVAVAITDSSTVSVQFEMNLLPRSMQQVVVPESTAEGIVQVVFQEATAGGVPGPWHAWASSIDNESGDAWSQMAAPGQ